MNRKSKFVRVPRSMADIGALREMAAAINALLNGSMTQGGSVIYADGNTVWDLPPQQSTTSETFYPFKTYQPTNLSTFVGKTCPLISSNTVGNGTLTTCILAKPNADGSSTTDLSASPPIVCISETWRFWSVRDGVVEVRPIYTVPVGGEEINNYASALLPTNTDGVANPEVSTRAFDDDTTETINPPLVIGSGTPSGQQLFVVIFAQITQDTSAANEPTVALMGWFDVSEFDNQTIGPFVPEGNNQIAISTIVYNPAAGLLESNNYIFDHATNRFPVGNGNFGGNRSSTVFNYRGQALWDQTSGIGTCSPADLGKQVFYPGDVLWLYQVNTSGSGTIVYNNLFMFTGQSPSAITVFNDNQTPNPAGDANWTTIYSAGGGNTQIPTLPV